jgi:hypothetical protein
LTATVVDVDVDVDVVVDGDGAVDVAATLVVDVQQRCERFRSVAAVGGEEVARGSPP